MSTDRDHAGRTPLHYATVDPPVGLKNIAAQSDPALAADNARVAEEYRITNTQRLLAAGADVNATDDEGSTPLHFAAQDDSAVVVQLLLDAGADVNVVDSKGETPLFKATMNTTGGAAPIAALLLERGADPNAQAFDGFTPLLVVKRYGKPDMRELFAELL
jgi:uncharacterized protein